MYLITQSQVCKSLNINELNLNNLINTKKLTIIKNEENEDCFDKKEVQALKKELKLIFNQKIEITFSKEDEIVLDGQSKICNWLYNHLLELCIDDYKNCDKLQLMKGRNLRDQVPKLKEEFPFLTTVYSSPLKNVAIRLRETYDRLFKKLGGYPNFKSFKKSWFSLYYDESNKGFNLNKKYLTISLGKDEFNKQIKVIGKLKEKVKSAQLKTFRLTKENDKFYAIFTLEKEKPKTIKTPKSFISLDPNHKNFFVGIDNNGQTYEFKNIYQIKYFDNIIDDLKSKRDKCKRKYKKRTTLHENDYYVPNKKWLQYNKAIKRAESRRREQIKSILYTYAHFIAKNYDEVLIGDYTPTKGTAVFDNMHRSMLNQTMIGEFRKILNWVMTKEGKIYTLVNEKNTTKECCICGHEEHKAPNIREFTCVNCNTHIIRDVNSAINIAKKKSKTVKAPHLDIIDKSGYFDFKKYKLVVA